ncbi:MAG TPA: alpha-1,4-glucan--maltose-1-phosphate maltosyltransferase [Mycobacteriales bacterium]|nr:alpha-1,4-glucan--maltose-1-phosphate maltosyltransferase [Mycobacteriales bacterium]
MAVGRIVITDLGPVVSCGAYPAKAVRGERVEVVATVFREGHDAVAADVVVTRPDGTRLPFLRMAPGFEDRWTADFVADAEGTWSFAVEGWSDPLGTWWHDAPLKVDADVDVELTLEEGAVLYERAASALPAQLKPVALAALHALRVEGPPRARLDAALDPTVVRLLQQHPLRELVTRGAELALQVDRTRALYGSWYELFPRSEGATSRRSGTFATAAKRLPAVAKMGFDVVYFPPIHPIGRVNRKGPNNALDAGPKDPGSPWAIGSDEGGHDAIHPDLGTLEDFDAFVSRARSLGMEVALDLALQCAPDHPWVGKHPEWFRHRLDGTIAYAENPPKKYQDIYPLSFDEDRAGITDEVERVLRHWMTHGVRVFRVDNPHTKPLDFWEDLLGRIRRTDPDVVFLSEAFTRPAMMHELGRLGFHQSYTYFTWRTAKAELQDYVRELVASHRHMRPNFFVNTPDILHAYLQYGGPAAFKVRAVLAALLSPSWGVYAGYELLEHEAVRPGSEEYLDSEKYQVKRRDWRSAPLTPYLTALNRFRRAHPALHWLTNVTFHDVDNSEVMAWSKREGDDVVLVVVNLDPRTEHEATLHLDLPSLGVGWDDQVLVTDELTGQSWTWGRSSYVRLDPRQEPAHLLTVRRAHPAEQGHWG